MKLGYKITQSATDDLLSALAPALGSDSPLFICSINKMRPLVDRLIVTDRRLLAVLQSDRKVKWDVARSEVRDIEPNEKWSNLTFQLADGSSMKFGVVRPEDQKEIVAIFNGSAGAPPELRDSASHEPTTPPPAVRQGVGQDEDAADTEKALIQEAKEAAKQAKREAKADQRREKQQRLEEELAQRKADREREKGLEEQRRRELDRQAGRQVLSEMFGSRQVALFANGFVTVSLGFGRPKYQKLIAIKADRAIQDKSAGGRALAAMATAGVSTLYSNENFKSFLTIVTEGQTFSLQDQGARTYQIALKLATAGSALIESSARTPPPPAAGEPPVASTVPNVTTASTPSPGESPPVNDLATQLRDLAALHDSGVLSDEEFAAAKARVLSGA